MKNGGKNKSVTFIILFSVYIYIYIYTLLTSNFLIDVCTYLTYVCMLI